MTTEIIVALKGRNLFEDEVYQLLLFEDKSINNFTLQIE